MSTLMNESVINIQIANASILHSVAEGNSSFEETTYSVK